MNLENAKIIGINKGNVIAKENYLEDEVIPLCLNVELKTGEHITIYPMSDQEGNGFGVLNARDTKGNHYYLEGRSK